MNNIKIDPEFQALLPPLDESTYAALEASILEHGCRDPLVLWGDILVDGHNRYEICTRHKLPFKTVGIEFDSREEAMIWIISTQFARRNLTPMQQTILRGKSYLLTMKIKTNEKGRNQHSEVGVQNALQPTHNATAVELGEKFKVNQATIRRDGMSVRGLQRITEVSPIAGRKIRSEEVRVEKQVLQSARKMPEDELAQLVEAIENGTYVKPRHRSPKPEPGTADKQGAGGASTPATPADPSHPFQLTIFMLMDDLSSELKEVEADDIKAQKTALRSYIDKLEELYKGL